MLSFLLGFVLVLILFVLNFFLILWEKKKDFILFQDFLPVAFRNIDMQYIFKTKRIVSRVGGGVMHDIYFLHYSILYFLKLFHSIYIQVSIARNSNETISVWQGKIMSACLWILLLTLHQTFSLSVFTTKHDYNGWLSWRWTAVHGNCGSDPMVSRHLQNCKSWVTSVEFPKLISCCQSFLNGKMQGIALTALWNPTQLLSPIGQINDWR